MVSKNQKEIADKFEKNNSYSLDDAVRMVKELTYAKFDESVDLAINLNVDPRHAEENIRLTLPLPNGTGKDVSILVITSGPKEKEALDAGADYVGNNEYLDKIKNGWSDVDKIVATPDMMPQLGKLGKILGPKGLMPNPKSGTVTMDVGKAVRELKAGQVELRVEKAGIIHVTCGKVSFKNDALIQNIEAIYDTLIKARPSSVKGNYLERMFISSTLGPGIKVDHTSIR
ncbi:MAG: 50S ribosomal protein L1 [Candidatus Marinimicrobia bacterium]|nr:50S ribosomal protein L1 [Candidatus Neomarinimicrobiota bacterium]